MQEIDWSEASCSTQPFSPEGLVSVGRVVDCYDGDTLQVVMPFLDQLFRFTLRLHGIDAPEMKGSTRSKAIVTRDRVLQLITGAVVLPVLRDREAVRSLLKDTVALVQVECLGCDKYGRVLAHVRPTVDGDTISDVLIREGFAVSYDGGSKQQPQ